MALFSDAAPRVPSAVLRLAPGQVYVPMEGWYWFKPGRATSLQRYDPVGELWRYAGDDSEALRPIYCDGLTVRIANPTGCAVGSVVTNAGSGYTSAPTVTASAGGSSWTAVVGGALSTSATIADAGQSYTYPPLLWIEQPPAPGVQATGYCTVSNGTISAVTIDNQGAGYTYPPNVAVLNDPRDTTGQGGQVSVSLTGAGTVTAVLCNNHGSPITSGTVPTLAFSGGGGSAAAATAIMDWCVQSVSITTAGAGYTGTAGALTASGAGGYVIASRAYVGNDDSTRLQRWRAAAIDMTTNASGGMSAVGAIIDGGRYQGIPTPTITAAQTPSTIGALSFVMGGTPTTVFLMPAQKQ